MQTITTKELPTEIRKLLGLSYRKRCVFVSENTESITPYRHYWDGGSKSTWTIWNPRTNQWEYPKLGGYPQFKSEPIELKGYKIVVVHRIFQGKTGTAHIYLPKSLEQE